MMSWFDRDLIPGTLASLPSVLPLDQRAKGNSLKKICHHKIPIHFFEHKFLMANFPLPVGLEVACSARVREVLGSNLGQTRTSKNSTLEELITIFFRTLRVPTLRFGGSFFLYLTFYSNPFCPGLIC